MNLNQENDIERNQIRYYHESSGELLVDEVTYSHSIIISPNKTIQQWQPSCIAELCEADFDFLLEYAESAYPENSIILLGTGAKHDFVAPKLYQSLLNKNIAIECMSTAAACRTYTVLSCEFRPVVAALLLS